MHEKITVFVIVLIDANNTASCRWWCQPVSPWSVVLWRARTLYSLVLLESRDVRSDPHTGAPRRLHPACMTADCQYCSTTNSTGSMSLSEWSTSWLSWCAGVWRTKLQGTWWSAALWSPTSPADIDVQPSCTVWLFRGIDTDELLGLLCWGSAGLELTVSRTAWADCQLLWLSSHVKNYFIREVLVYSAQ